MPTTPTSSPTSSTSQDASATSTQIAGELVVAEATVKAHVSHILTKLDADNRVQIAICVHEAGLDEPS